MRSNTEFLYQNMHFRLLVCKDTTSGADNKSQQAQQSLPAGGVVLPCKSFHNFEQEIEYEGIQEGGMNEGVHLRAKPLSKPFTFQVERYVGPRYTDPLVVGAGFPGGLVLQVGVSADHFDEPVASFWFQNCIVTGKSYGGMDAEKSGLIVVTTTVAYESVTVKWKG